MAVKALIRIIRGLWATIPTLAFGQMGYAYDKKKLVIGDSLGNTTLVDLENIHNATPRPTLVYKDADKLTVNQKHFVMNGFRFGGHHLKTGGKLASIQDTTVMGNIDFKLDRITPNIEYNQWYGAFGVIEDGNDYVTFKAVPFMMIKEILANTMTFTNGGFNGDTSLQRDYNIPIDELANRDILYCQENGFFSGKSRKVVSNDLVSLTVDNIEGLQPLDSILLAPQNDDYVYLGSFYIDTAEQLNRGDDGANVLFRGVSMTDQSANIDRNDAVNWQNINFRQFVSPLATSVWFYYYETIGTADLGYTVTQFGVDFGLHDVQQTRWDKVNATSDAYRHPTFMIPFLHKQDTGIKFFGTVTSAKTAHEIINRGYVER